MLLWHNNSNSNSNRGIRALLTSLDRLGSLELAGPINWFPVIDYDFYATIVFLG
jgi:hypothetical protein